MEEDHHIGYVVMSSYGKEHHIVMHILENKYGGNEPFKGGFNKEPI